MQKAPPIGGSLFNKVISFRNPVWGAQILPDFVILFELLVYSGAAFAGANRPYCRAIASAQPSPHRRFPRSDRRDLGEILTVSAVACNFG